MTRSLVAAVSLLAVLAALPAWAAKNQLPTVAITSPVSGATFIPPATIQLAASATDPDGSVAKVEFYQGAALLGTSTAAPHGILWSSVPAGTYTLTAKATDNRGRTQTSAAVSISVADPPLLISTPVEGAALYGGSVTVRGTFVGDPAITTILVDNGNSSRLASLSGDTFSAVLPLFRGANVLTASLARTDRSHGAAKVTVTGNDAPFVRFLAPAATTLEAPGSIDLEAEAISPGGTIGQVEFLRNGALLATVAQEPYRHRWQNVPVGTHSLAARATDNNNVASTATKTITVTGPNSQPDVALTGPSEGAAYEAPAEIVLQATASDADGGIARVEFLSGGAVLGSDATAPYSFLWRGVAAGTYTLSARAVDDRGAAVLSAPVSISVVDPPPPNVSPTVTLSIPANGAEYVAPATIDLGANAADSDGAISKVDFFAGSALIATVTSPPYVYTWPVVPAGEYLLSARATDDLGATTQSAAVGITVSPEPPNEPPSVTLTAPSAGTSFYVPGVIDLAADAQDPDGSIAKVEFYSGNTHLGTAASSPYRLAWTDPSPGRHTLTAMAYDDAGAATTSGAVEVTVNELRLTITTPLEGQSMDGDHVLVSGTFEGPFNSGITVNGAVAAVRNNQFHAHATLGSGANPIAVVLRTPGGQSIETSVMAYADGAPPILRIAADSFEGVAPFTASFLLTNAQAVDVTAQVNGGPTFTVGAATTVPVSVTCQAPGACDARFDAYDPAGASMTRSYKLVAHGPAEIDQRFTAIWNALSQALTAGDKAAALVWLSAPARATYGPVFDLLMPEYAQIVAGWSPPLRGALSADVGEYAVVVPGVETSSVFLIYFVRGADGIWRLDSM